MLCALGASVAGCSDKFFDPGQIGRFRPTPAVNVILDSLGVAEEAAVAWENAEEPKPSDIVAATRDYALQPGDIVRISIFELFQEFVLLVNDYTVSETGNVSIPEVGIVQAAGLTETQLEEEIKRILAPGILRDPSVTVTLVDSQQRTFSVLGNGVARPGRYVVPRYDFRLADALATAGAQMQFNVSYVYISRRDEAMAVPVGPKPGREFQELELIEPAPPQRESPAAPPARPERQDSVTPVPPREIPEPSEPAEKFETEREMLELITPHATGSPDAKHRVGEPKVSWPQSGKVTGASAGGVKTYDIAATSMPNGFRLLVPPKPADAQKPVEPEKILLSPIEFGTVGPALAPSAAPQAKERIEWVFRDGKWIPIPVTGDEGRKAPAAEAEPGPGIEWVFRDGRWIQVRKGVPEAAKPPATEAEPGAGIEWVFRDGRWIQVRKGAPEAAKPPARIEPEPPTLPLEGEKLPMELEWEQAIQTRLIRIPADKLLAGDPRYNVVIKPGDAIHVPVDIIGEFAIMGNVNRSGFINITGRPMTLKMAVAAAGGLGPLAWPKHVEVVRRVGTRKEEIVLVDLDKIASGEQPDFFIKPNDLINVGTHPTSRWRAILRNAFRAAYGFGFVYDRNFADADFGKGFTRPHWF